MESKKKQEGDIKWKRKEKRSGMGNIGREKRRYCMRELWTEKREESIRADNHRDTTQYVTSFYFIFVESRSSWFRFWGCSLCRFCSPSASLCLACTVMMLSHYIMLHKALMHKENSMLASLYLCELPWNKKNRLQLLFNSELQNSYKTPQTSRANTERALMGCFLNYSLNSPHTVHCKFVFIAGLR